MRISSSRHLKNWKPTPVSDFARYPYMLMNLGQRDEPQLLPLIKAAYPQYDGPTRVQDEEVSSNQFYTIH